MDPRLAVELCRVGAEVGTAEEALRLLAEAAVAEGYARPSFVEAVIERERVYPTGLPLPLPTAIPHSDPEHILRPGLAALVPTAGLTFGEMGGRDRTVEARLVLMLLVDDPAEQVSLLGRLITALQAPDLETRLLVGVRDAQELADRFAALFDASGPPAPKSSS